MLITSLGGEDDLWLISKHLLTYGYGTRRWRLLRHAVFSLPLADTARLRLVIRNFEDDEGVDYLVEPGGGGKAIEIAALEGHFRGPALAWPELINATGQPDRRFGPAERLLLLLPGCADTARPGTAVHTVAEAVTVVGARSAARQVAVELLDTGRYWQPCRWTEADGTRLCEGSHAYRQLGGALSPADLRMVSQAFDPPSADVALRVR